MVYRFKVIFIVVLVSLVPGLLMAAGAPDGDYLPVNRYLNWVPTAEIESRLGAGVREDMAALIGPAFADLTSDLRHSLNKKFTLSESERAYYFDDSPVRYSADIDLLTIHSVDSWVRGFLEAWYSSGNSQDCYKTIYNNVSLSPLFNKSYSSQNSLELAAKVSWNGRKYDYSDRILRNSPLINSTTNVENLYIIKEPFYTPEGSLYSFRYWDSGYRGSASRRGFRWDSSGTSATVYLAKDPRLNIYSPISRPDGELHLAEGELSAININAKHGVKLLAAQLYLEGRSQPEASYLRIVDGESLSESVDGLREFTIDLGAMQSDPRFLKAPGSLAEGRYRLIIGVVDKFNKIYLFEAENFVYDLSPPQLSGLHGAEPVNSSTALNQADSTLVSWSHIRDNYTAYQDLSDYIYIEFGGNGAIPVKEAFAGGEPIFCLEEGRVKLAREGDYGPMNIYLQDLAGNKTTLAENKTFTYYITHPEVTLSEPERIYRSGEELTLRVNDISGLLRVAKLRVISADGRVNEAILQDIPARLSAFSFERKLLSRTVELSEKRALLERLYTKRGRAYYLAPELNEADESALRALLAEVGYNSYGPITEIKVPLSHLEGYRGPFRIKVEVADIGGNLNREDNREFSSYLSDLKDDLTITVGGELLPAEGRAIYNLAQRLLIERKNRLIESYDIKVSSPALSDSSNSRTLSGQSAGSWAMTLTTDSRLQAEELLIEVTAHYSSGEMVTFKRALLIYNDSSGPAVTVSEESPGSFRITISDPAGIDLAAVSYLALKSDNSPAAELGPLPAKSGESWNLKSWESLSGSGQSELSFSLALEPGSMGTIYAADRFGNDNSLNLAAATFKHDHLAAGYDFIIDSKADLIALDPVEHNYTVYGNVLIRCDLNLESYERFNITTLKERPTAVYLDSTNVGRPLVIRGGEGVITLKGDLNTISFTGIGKRYRLDSGTIGYSWFGLQGDNESLIRLGSETISFSNAVAPLSFLKPSADLILENIKVSESRMAVHWIDDPAAYNRLTLRNCELSNLVYGLKLERSPFRVQPAGWAESCYRLENTTVLGIRRATVYSGD